MRQIVPYLLVILLVLLTAGCASNPKPPEQPFKIEIWDCRGDKPRRVEEVDHSKGSDPLIPHFSAPVIPDIPPPEDSLPDRN